jgi:hypothetical protein
MIYRPNQTPLICYSCGGYGYFAKDCQNYHAHYIGNETYVGAVENNADYVLGQYYDQNWYMDSRASSHVTGQQASLELISDSLPAQNVTTADGNSHRVGVVGSTTVASTSGGINLHKVLYVLALQHNLISVRSLTDEGHTIVFTDTQCLILDANKQVLVIGDQNLHNGLYQIRNISGSINAVLTNHTLDKHDMHLWHQRLGHLHYAWLQHLSRSQRVHELPFFGTLREIYSDCMAGKQHRERFPKASQNSASQVLQLVHSDLVGPRNFDI